MDSFWNEEKYKECISRAVACLVDVEVGCI
jgi:hypothetical protein